MEQNKSETIRARGTGVHGSWDRSETIRTQEDNKRTIGRTG